MSSDDREAALHLLFLARQPSDDTQQLAEPGGAQRDGDDDDSDDEDVDVDDGVDVCDDDVKALPDSRKQAQAALGGTTASPIGILQQQQQQQQQLQCAGALTGGDPAVPCVVMAAAAPQDLSAGGRRAGRAAGQRTRRSVAESDVDDVSGKRARHLSKRSEAADQQDLSYPALQPAGGESSWRHQGSSQGVLVPLPIGAKRRRKFVVSSKVPVAEAVVQKLQYAASFFPELQWRQSPQSQVTASCLDQEEQQRGRRQRTDSAAAAPASVASTASTRRAASLDTALKPNLAGQVMARPQGPGHLDTLAAAADLEVLDGGAAAASGVPEGTAASQGPWLRSSCASGGEIHGDDHDEHDEHELVGAADQQQELAHVVLQHKQGQPHRSSVGRRVGRGGSRSSCATAAGSSCMPPDDLLPGSLGPAAAPAAESTGHFASSSGGTGGKSRGGRPRGAGNRVQMAPRAVGRSGQPGFALRSEKFTGYTRARGPETAGGHSSATATRCEPRPRL